MYDNESYLKSYNCDLEAADRELQQKKDLWKGAGNVGNLPIPTLLDIAWKHQKKEKYKPKGRPKGAKNKPKPELVTSDG